MWGALSKDMEAALASNPQALSAWRMAANAYKKDLDALGMTLKKLGDQGKTPAQVYALTKKNDSEALFQILKPLTRQEKDVIRRGAWERLGMGDGVEWSAEEFLKNYDRLFPRVRQLIFGDKTTQDSIRAMRETLRLIEEQAARGTFSDRHPLMARLTPWLAGGGVATGLGIYGINEVSDAIRSTGNRP